MKKLALLAFLSLFLKSCSNSDLSCNSDLVKSNVKDLLLESELKNGGDYTSMFNVSQKDVEQVFNKVIKIANVKTIAQDNTLKSCECQASLLFEVNEEVMGEIKKITNAQFGQLLMNGIVDKNGIEINYSLQETADGEIQIEIGDVDDIDINVATYSLGLKGFDKAKEQKESTDRNLDFTEESYNNAPTTNPADLKHGTITGSNVILRTSPSTSSDKLDVLKGAGEKVKILETQIASNSAQAITKTEVKVTIGKENITLPKGKAVKIISRNDQSQIATITFNDVKSVERTTDLNYKQLEFIGDSDWYKVETQKAKIGWVYGKFITEGAAYSSNDIRLNSKKIFIYNTPEDIEEYMEAGGDDWGYFTHKVSEFFKEKYPGVEVSEFYNSNLSSQEIAHLKKELNLEGFGYVLINGETSRFIIHNQPDEIISEVREFFGFSK